jgi:hypothetical protein
VITTACSITYCNGACWGFNNNKKFLITKKKDKGAPEIRVNGEKLQITYDLKVKGLPFKNETCYESLSNYPVQIECTF